MDKKWRSGKFNSSRSYQKGRRSGVGGDRPFRPTKPADDSTCAIDLAEYVLNALIGGADLVQIKRENIAPHHTRISATCDPTLTGKLIGKGGKTISALRLLARTVAFEHGQQIDIELDSTGESTSEANFNSTGEQ